MINKIIAIALILGILALGTLAVAAPSISAAPLIGGTAVKVSDCNTFPGWSAEFGGSVYSGDCHPIG